MQRPSRFVPLEVTKVTIHSVNLSDLVGNLRGLIAQPKSGNRLRRNAEPSQLRLDRLNTPGRQRAIELSISGAGPSTDQQEPCATING